MDLPTDQRREDEMKAYEPTLGERIASGLQSAFESLGANRYKARQRAQTIIGGPSSNLPLNMGLADVAASVNAPAALAMAPVYASQGMKDLGEAAAAAGRGDYIGAGVEGAFGALNMMPLVSGLTGLAKKAMKPAEVIEEIPYEPPRTNVLRAAEPAPQAAPDVQPVQTVQMPDGRFATSTQLSEVKQIRTGYDTADSPAAVAHLTAGLRKSPQEQLVAVVVDENNKPLQVIRHTIGLSGQTQAEPFSLVGAIANVPGAKSYWLSHNHPSGNTSLSNADIQLAKQIRELTRETGLEMRGVLAIGKDRFGFSDLQNAPAQNLPIPPRARDRTVSMTERTFKRSGVLDNQAVSGATDAARMADQIAGDQTGVVLLNSQLQPVGFMPLKESELMNLRKSGESNRLLAAMEKANSPRALLVSNKSLSDAKVGNVSALFNKAGVNLVDVVHGPQRESMMMNVGRIPSSPTGTFKTIAPIGVGLTAAAVMSPEETYAKGGMIKPIKPLQLPETPPMPEDLPRRQVRRPDGLSEPEAEQAREQSLDRLRRLLEPNYQRGGAVKAKVKEVIRDILSPAEREANKAKFLEESKVQERLYHATPRDFSEFMPGGENPAVSGPAIWMSPSATNQPAAHNIRTIPGKPGHVYRDPKMYTPGTNVMPLYSSIKNPVVATEATWKQDFKPFGGGSPWTMTAEEVQRMKEAGHDGILYYNKNGALEEVIAFEPQQVKSAIGNRGTYDPAERDITKARGGLAAITRRK